MKTQRRLIRLPIPGALLAVCALFYPRFLAPLRGDDLTLAVIAVSVVVVAVHRLTGRRRALADFDFSAHSGVDQEQQAPPLEHLAFESCYAIGKLSLIETLNEAPQASQ